LNRHGLALSRARVLVLGLAYKRNSSDARESPAAALINVLLAEGADVSVADPHVVEQHLLDSNVRRVKLSRPELKRADVVVLVTDHDAFDYDLVTAHATCVLDTRHRIEGPHVEQL
jgi:UDP-N-acetyl-D-glucosamine dehydrogenase